MEALKNIPVMFNVLGFFFDVVVVFGLWIFLFYFLFFLPISFICWFHLWTFWQVNILGGHFLFLLYSFQVQEAEENPVLNKAQSIHVFFQGSFDFDMHH